ncbi:MAG: hypothetical protein V1930_08660, partial [Pseudomonadota bacterium]
MGRYLRFGAYLFLIVVAGKLLWNHYLLISCHLPLEYREAHIPATTHLLLEGKNPFALELQPE